MSTLIVGPSSVGKSTYISMLQETDDNTSAVRFGFEIDAAGLPDEGYVHYNLLHRYISQDVDEPSLLLAEDLYAEPIFSRILTSGTVRRAVVLVASYADLQSRMERRILVERGHEAVYDSKCWLTILKHADLFRLYEALFDALEQKSIPYRVVFSRDDADTPFVESDRVCVHRHLKGEPCQLPTRKAVATVANSSLCEYQTIPLPYGMKTNSGYPHRDRHDGYLRCIPRHVVGKSMLDIGCALGGLLLTAERLGAAPGVGVDLNVRRLSGALVIKDLLQSRNEYMQGDFLTMPIDREFDCVFVLNVIHHIENYYDFLKKACSLARRMVIIEFPTLQDKRFAEVSGLCPRQLRDLDKGALIGVSSATVDQSYVFTQKAMDAIIVEKIGGFRASEHRESTLKNRIIATYQRVS